MPAHRFKVLLTKTPDTTGLVSGKRVSLREKILTALLGSKHNLTVLVPGDQVQSVEIVKPAPDDELLALADAVLAHPCGQKKKKAGK